MAEAHPCESDILVEYSYYGAATGRWDQRPVKEGVNRPFNCGPLSRARHLPSSSGRPVGAGRGLRRRGERGIRRTAAPALVHRCQRRGHGPFRGRQAPHEDVRGGRLNVCSGVRKVRRQPIQRGRHNHRPSGTSAARRTEPGRTDLGQAAFAWPHSKEVPSTQIQWRIMAIFRAIATFAFFMPIRFASFIPQALSVDHFLVRWSSTLAASNK
jgi:hypothetical protein